MAEQNSKHDDAECRVCVLVLLHQVELDNTINSAFKNCSAQCQDKLILMINGGFCCNILWHCIKIFNTVNFSIVINSLTHLLMRYLTNVLLCKLYTTVNR